MQAEGCSYFALPMSSPSCSFSFLIPLLRRNDSSSAFSCRVCCIAWMVLLRGIREYTNRPMLKMKYQPPTPQDDVKEENEHKQPDWVAVIRGCPPCIVVTLDKKKKADDAQDPKHHPTTGLGCWPPKVECRGLLFWHRSQASFLPPSTSKIKTRQQATHAAETRKPKSLREK